MGDRSAYLAPGGYSAGGSNPGGHSSGSGSKGGSYSREEYAWSTGGSSGGGSSSGGGGGGGGYNPATNVTKPKSDTSCYLAPK